METGKSEPLRNVQGLLGSGIDRIVSVALTPSIAVDLRKKMRAFAQDRVTVLTPMEFLRHLRSGGDPFLASPSDSGR